MRTIMQGSRGLWGSLIAILGLFSVLLVGCAPGVGSSGTGYPNGTQLGTITGFGSVIVESTRYDDTNATILIESDFDTFESGTVSDVQLGMQAIVDFESNNVASRLLLRPQIVGFVDSVSTSGFSLMGQDVTVTSTNQQTVLEGFEELAELVGQRVRVFGWFGPDGDMTATRVERLYLLDDATPRLSGVVSADDGEGTFTVGRLSIQGSSAEVLPVGRVVTTGDIVTVFLDSHDASKATATGVVIRSTSELTGQQIRIGDIIREIKADGSLTVGPFTVDARNATIVSAGAVASPTDLNVGQSVRISGFMMNGALIADQIDSVDSVVDPTSVRGPITDYFFVNSFRVRNTLIDASTATFIGGSDLNLLDDVTVEATGQLVDGRLVAETVEFVLEDSNAEHTLYGVISAYDESARTMNLMGQLAQIANQIVITDPEGEPLAISALANGKKILSRGYLEDGVYLVDRITVFETGGNPFRKVTGTAYAVDLDANEMRVGRVTIQWNDQTVVVGNLQSLEMGAKVRLEGVINETVLTATRMEIQ